MDCCYNENAKKLKFIHVKCQNILRKKSHSETTFRDCGMKTLYGFPEQLLNHYDVEKFRHSQNENFVSFRVAQISSQKSKKGR